MPRVEWMEHNAVLADEMRAASDGAEPPKPPGPVKMRRQFSKDAELMMQADVLDRTHLQQIKGVCRFCTEIPYVLGEVFLGVLKT